MRPSKRPTPSEYAVLSVFASIVFIVLGLAALIVASRAPAENQELAAKLFQGGIMSLSLGLIIAVSFWLCRKLTG